MANYAIFPERIKTTANDGVLVEADNVSVSVGSGVTTNLQARMTVLGSAAIELGSTVSNLKVKDASVSADGKTLTINKTDGNVTFTGGEPTNYIKSAKLNCGNLILTPNLGSNIEYSGPEKYITEASVSSNNILTLNNNNGTSVTYDGGSSYKYYNEQYSLDNESVEIGNESSGFKLMKLKIGSNAIECKQNSISDEVITSSGSSILTNTGAGLTYSLSIGSSVSIQSKPLVYDITPSTDGITIHYTDGTTKNITISSQGGSIVIE